MRVYAWQHNGVIAIVAVSDAGAVALYRNPSAEIKADSDGEITDAKTVSELLRVARLIEGNVNSDLRIAIQSALTRMLEDCGDVFGVRRK